MHRRLWLLRLGLALALVFALAPSPVLAQRDPITGFFNMIFGQPRRAPEAPAAPIEAPKKAKPAEPKIVEQPKNPDAQTVLVLGDIEAAGLGVGLQMAFAEEPALAVLTRTKAAAGLARDGEQDWLTAGTRFLVEHPADFLVVMIGINDWQPIAQAGAKPLEPGSEEWMRRYAERLDRWITALKATGKPFWWVGLPPTADADLGPTRRAAFAAFLSSLNDLARPRVEAAGGTFVDIWAAFTDEEGHYTQMGPDITGQVKRLRMNDGILFTRAGQRKLAFFVEAGILRGKRGETIVAVPEEPVIVQPRPEEVVIGAPPPLPPAPWASVGPVLPLEDSPPDADQPLAGAPGRPQPVALPGGFPLAATPAHRRLVEGLPLDPPAGRVDAGVRRAP